MPRSRNRLRSFRLDSSSSHRRHDTIQPAHPVGAGADHHVLPLADLDDGNAGIGGVAPLYRNAGSRATVTIVVTKAHERSRLEHELVFEA